MSTKKKIFIGIGVVVGLIVLLLAFVFISTGKERDLASQFVTDISNGRLSDAYSQYSEALKEVQDQATFEAEVESLKLDSSCKLEISGLESSVSTDYGSIKSVKGKVKCDDVTLETADFTYDSDSKLVKFLIKP